MPSGGPRPNSGRPRKPVAEKVLEGNAGKRAITVLSFPENNQKPNNQKPINQKPKNQKPKPPDYLNQPGKEGDDLIPKAGAIYAALVDFIAGAGCLDYIPPPLIEDFAHLRRAYLEAESMNRRLGRIANGKRSPYVSISLDYQKASLAVFTQIWSIISESSTQVYDKDKNTFLSSLEKRGF